MANVRLRWTLPTTRESGNPLPVSEIKHVKIEVSADATNYGLVGEFLPTELETLVEALDTGVWTFRGLVYDTKNRVSNPTIASVVVDESAPSELILTLELV